MLTWVIGCLLVFCTALYYLSIWIAICCYPDLADVLPDLISVAVKKCFDQKPYWKKGFVLAYNFQAEPIIKGSQGRTSWQELGEMLLAGVFPDHSRVHGVHASLASIYSPDSLTQGLCLLQWAQPLPASINNLHSPSQMSQQANLIYTIVQLKHLFSDDFKLW